MNRRDFLKHSSLSMAGVAGIVGASGVLLAAPGCAAGSPVPGEAPTPTPADPVPAEPVGSGANTSGMLNARDFGALGDGKADDTAALQKALDKAAATHGTVLVPAGVYRTGRLKMGENTGIQGFPSWSYRDDAGTILELIDDKAAGLLDLTDAAGATVHGLCLNGKNLGTKIAGIRIDKADYHKEDGICIERCRIHDFSGDGILLNRIWCFSLRSNMVAFNKGHGVKLFGWDGFILDNWLTANAMSGIGALEGSAAITITANRIEWNQQGGIVVFGGDHYNITGNYIDRSGGPGIALVQRMARGCQTATITSNVVNRSAAPFGREVDDKHNCHIRIDGAQGVVCSGNALNAGRDDGGQGVWSPAYGLVVAKLENCIVKDNVLHRGSMKALILDGGGHNEGTLIKDNPGCLLEPPVDPPKAAPAPTPAPAPAP